MRNRKEKRKKHRKISDKTLGEISRGKKRKRCRKKIEVK